MKHLLFSIILLQSFSAFSQNCQNYYFMTNNSQVQVTIYDAKGKASGTQAWNITDVKKVGNSFESKVDMNFTDEKGKQVTSGSGVYKCANGVLQADMTMAMPQQPGYKITGSTEKLYIEYPSDLSVGQTLKDVDAKMNAEMGKGMPAAIEFRQNNRKVEGKEKVTTSSGSWDAYVISYDGFFRVQFSGIGVPMNMKVKEWFVPNFGIVKSETYNKNGKLMGSTLLTSIKK